MVSRSDTPTQGEVCERVEAHDRDMGEKIEDIEKSVEDLETVRHTLEQLEFAGTREGADDVERSIDDAEQSSDRDYDRKSDELGEIQGETEKDADEFDDRGERSDSDARSIESGEGQITGLDAKAEFDRAKQRALEDVGFLKEQTQRALESIEESRRVHEGLESRAKSGKGA